VRRLIHRAAPGCAYRSCVAGAIGRCQRCTCLACAPVLQLAHVQAHAVDAFLFGRDRQRRQNLFGNLGAVCAQIGARYPLIKPHSKYLCPDLYPTTCLVNSTREWAKKTVSPCRCIIAIHLSPRLIINMGPGGGPAGQRAFRQVMGRLTQRRIHAARTTRDGRTYV
jgi:hypothetical protein